MNKAFLLIVCLLCSGLIMAQSPILDKKDMENENMTQVDKGYMELAIQLAKESINEGDGPFAAIIVKDGKVIAKGNNCVIVTNDPTAHAEIAVI